MDLANSKKMIWFFSDWAGSVFSFLFSPIRALPKPFVQHVLLYLLSFR